MQEGRVYFLQEGCSGKEALAARRGRPSPDHDPSLLEYLEQAFTRIELYRAENHAEKEGGLPLVIILAAALSACLLLALNMPL
ncbi:hypothetical protein J2Z49_001870 [Desulfofundulus luciae]|uniref:Uncharacterized protein n=1 Tax=Desulfofundulus luciae TaxID=74702 RepID=A0ABU0B1Z7_9FIRM|nr:hypothetical protein [Desulfofundulus luciae]MDQ0286753.1 hypothetical protein [Desulfofundulus luciae]